MKIENTPIHKHLTTNLLYPAILGAMFYNFLPVVFDYNIMRGAPLQFLCCLLVFVYFFFDYVFTVSHKTYSALSCTLDCFAMIFLYRIELLLNPKENIGINDEIFIYFMIIHLLFIIWDLKEKAKQLIPFNIAIVFVFLCFWAFDAGAAPLLFAEISMCLYFFYTIKRSERE